MAKDIDLFNRSRPYFDSLETSDADLTAGALFALSFAFYSA